MTRSLNKRGRFLVKAVERVAEFKKRLSGVRDMSSLSKEGTRDNTDYKGVFAVYSRKYKTL